eukprot:scaffold297251_cov26-Tisochrysis_lutea.AAC.7
MTTARPTRWGRVPQIQRYWNGRRRRSRGTSRSKKHHHSHRWRCHRHSPRGHPSRATEGQYRELVPIGPSAMSRRPRAASGTHESKGEDPFPPLARWRPRHYRKIFQMPLQAHCDARSCTAVGLEQIDEARAHAETATLTRHRPVSRPPRPSAQSQVGRAKIREDSGPLAPCVGRRRPIRALAQLNGWTPLVPKVLRAGRRLVGRRRRGYAARPRPGGSRRYPEHHADDARRSYRSAKREIRPFVPLRRVQLPAPPAWLPPAGPAPRRPRPTYHSTHLEAARERGPYRRDPRRCRVEGGVASGSSFLRGDATCRRGP